MCAAWLLAASVVIGAHAPPPPGECAAGARNITLTAEPPSWACARVKTLVLIRHAEGTHNEAEAAEEARPTHHLREEHAALHASHGKAWVLLHAATGDRYLDPILTAEGERQAERLHAQMAALGVRVDAVALSPMRRTLQTAHVGIPQLRAPATRPRVLATELLRERVGPYTCDGRLPVSTLRDSFAHVDFSQVGEADTLFAYGKEHGDGEALKLAERAERAARWLLALPDELEHVAVVSHQHFLRAFTSRHAPSDDAAAADARAREEEAAREQHAGRMFRNAEMQTAHLCERS